ncbi:MAG: ATP-binding protein [Candidatus Aminicenantes bacterium]|nr:ATP-binding protein [Candidatus Aminicenantes bacterium]
MEDLSLHILDIVENSVAASADKIEIRISEDKKRDLLSIEIIDNGVGMDEETVKKALDPFFTTKTVRRFGFGLSLLSEAAKAANGHFSIKSKKGDGTRIKADFQYSHIDRKPLGDIGQTIITLVIGNPDIDLIYVHKKNSHKYNFDTKKIKAQLKDIPINSLDGIRKIKEKLASIFNF